MFDRLRETLGRVLTSKKALAAIAGVVIAFASRHGLDLDPETVEKIVTVIGAYILGQGIADHGKEAAK